jgi:hypothetical protein
MSTKIISHHFILNAETTDEVIRKTFKLPIDGRFAIKSYRAQPKLSTLNSTGENRYWINVDDLEGYHRFGGENGHDLICFPDEATLLPCDRQVKVQTETAVNGLSVEFEVKALGTTKPEIFIELELEHLHDAY